MSPSQNGELLKWKRATAPHSNQIDEAEGSEAAEQDSPGSLQQEATDQKGQRPTSASRLSSKLLYMEVAKQLSKDSYGAGEVPISSEVLSLLYSQQQLIAEQEKRMGEYERQISQSHAQEFTITQVDKKMSSVSESRHDLQSVAN